MAQPRQLKDLKEDQLVEALLAGVPVGKQVVIGPGDDCAAVKVPGAKHLLLLKTDCVVQNVHYLPEHNPARVGWKTLCRAISDIAAMGGEPQHALVNIFSPRDVTLAYWKGFYKGLSKAAKRFGVGIVGGETSSAPIAAVSLSLVGRVEPNRILTRSGGRPGDVLFVTGVLGGSIAGHHLDFIPRVSEARWLSAQGSVRAMMDLSDGLAADLPRLAQASGCGFEIDSSALPLRRGCTVEQALGDGEDYELLLAVAPRQAEKLAAAWKRQFPKVRLSAIGRLTKPGRSTKLSGGFDHFFHCQPPSEKPAKKHG